MNDTGTLAEWKQSLELMTEIYADGALNILLGKVETLTKHHLRIEDKQELFKHFIHILHPMFNKNHEVLDNGTYVFLKLFRKDFFLKRKSDLTAEQCYTFLFLLDNITKYKMIQHNYTNEDIAKFIDYREQVQKSANLVGIYTEFEEHNFKNEKRKHLLPKN